MVAALRGMYSFATWHEGDRTLFVARDAFGTTPLSHVDSGTTTRWASRSQDSNLHAVTRGFEEYRGTANHEAPLAMATAGRIGTRHETRWITRDTFESEFDALLSAMDQPSIDGVNTYFVSRCAAQS